MPTRLNHAMSDVRYVPLVRERAVLRAVLENRTWAPSSTWHADRMSDRGWIIGTVLDPQATARRSRRIVLTRRIALPAFHVVGQRLVVAGQLESQITTSTR
jgi:hypothetical protein